MGKLLAKPLLVQLRGLLGDTTGCSWVSVCEPWIHVGSLIVKKHAGVLDIADGHVEITEGDLRDPEFWGMCGRAFSS